MASVSGSPIRGPLEAPLIRTAIEGMTLCLGIFWFLTNLYLAWTTPLTPDEAHYALYGLKLDWSYFDHPPMVGWLQAWVLNRGFDIEFALRCFPIALNLLAIYLVWRWTLAVFGREAAVVTLALWWITPMLKLLGFVMVPEVPLLIFAFCTFIQTYRITLIGLVGWREWVLLGLFLGLSGLSKYTAVTLAFSVAVALLQSQGMRVLLQPRLWLAVFVAALVIAPVLYWNFEHDWLSFKYQLDHGAGRSEWNGIDGVRMQLTQMAAYTPLVYVLGAFVLMLAWVRGTAEQKLLLVFAAPILILFSLMAMKGRSLPHWTAVGAVFTLPLIASWLTSEKKTWQNYLAWGTAGLSLVVFILLHLVLFKAPLPYPDFQNPLRDVLGWKEIAAQLKDRAEQSMKSSKEPPAIFIPNWSHASRVAWYARPVTVFVLDKRYDQFDLWFGVPEQGRQGVVLAYRDDSGWHREGVEYFDSCQLLDHRLVESHGRSVNEFEVYQCKGFQGEPIRK